MSVATRLVARLIRDEVQAILTAAIEPGDQGVLQQRPRQACLNRPADPQGLESETNTGGSDVEFVTSRSVHKPQFASIRMASASSGGYDIADASRKLRLACSRFPRLQRVASTLPWARQAQGLATAGAGPAPS